MKGFSEKMNYSPTKQMITYLVWYFNENCCYDKEIEERYYLYSKAAFSLFVFNLFLRKSVVQKGNNIQINLFVVRFWLLAVLYININN